ncbi:MAG: type II toxin-antitoxin system RelE/ParE family toxin [Bacteroidia bacterium]|nr:type II toxin-antitoxin system RelE/ParE family toxin [Bacteroidia bacterium]
MVIKWTEEAEAKVDEIYLFYESRSKKVAKEIFADILTAVEQLVLFPKSAPLEPFLRHRPEKFRSLLVRDMYKIVYFINHEAEEIVISTIFDCRQNPDKLKREIRKSF